MEEKIFFCGQECGEGGARTEVERQAVMTECSRGVCGEAGGHEPR